MGARKEAGKFNAGVKMSFFDAVLSTARVLLVAVRRSSDRGWRSDDFLGPFVSDTRATGRGR